MFVGGWGDMTVLDLLGDGRYDCCRFVGGWGGMTVLGLLGDGVI